MELVMINKTRSILVALTFLVPLVLLDSIAWADSVPYYYIAQNTAYGDTGDGTTPQWNATVMQIDVASGDTAPAVPPPDEGVSFQSVSLSDLESDGYQAPDALANLPS